MKRYATLALVAMCLGATSALATETREAEEVELDTAVFGFMGVLTDQDMGASANPLGVRYERNLSAAVGAQFYALHRNGASLGVEVGVGLRAGQGERTHEAWAGPVLRHEGVRLGEKIAISPSFTAGLSVVDRTHPGRERRQEVRDEGSAALLFYLGPEISISTVDRPEVETFWRLHHRSGAGGTLGGMRGAMNANVLGIRHRF